MTADASNIMITGRAYQRRATLEVAGDILTWRAQRGQVQPIAENIATTTDSVRGVTWIERHWSHGGIALAVLSILWMVTQRRGFGAATCAIAIAAVLIIYRQARPRRWLALDLGERWFVLEVDAPSADAARALAGRIERRLLTGEVAASPPMLP